MYTNAAKTKRPAGMVLDALANFYHKRWLLRYLIHRQLIRSYQKSTLGSVWIILGPLIWVSFLALVFSKYGVKNRLVPGPIDMNFGLYLYCGLLPFTAYSESMTKGANSIRSSAGLVQKVVFPLELLPFTTAVTALVDKFFGVGALMLVLWILEHRLEWTVIFLPLFILPQLLFIMGLAYFMAVVGTYVPDISEVFRPIVRGSFFLTPILWPASRVPERLHLLIDLNPLAYLVGTYRDLILYGELPGMLATLYFTLFAGTLFVVSFALFVRFKSRFADLI